MLDPRISNSSQPELSGQATTPAPQAPRLRFNFERAKAAGASDEQILEFLRQKDTNIDWGTLQERANKQQNPLAYQLATLAQNDWDFLPPQTSAQTPAQQNPLQTPDTPAQDSTQDPAQNLAPETEKRLKELERENGLRGIIRRNLWDKLQSEEMIRDTKLLEESEQQAKISGLEFDSLPQALKTHLVKKQDLNTGNLSVDTTIMLLPQSDKEKFAKAAYDTERKALEIAQKSPEQLSEQEQKFIKDRTSLWRRLWDSDEEIYHNFIEKTRAHKIVPQEMKHAMEVLDNLHEHKSIKTLLMGSDEKKRQNYLDSAHTIATNLGFEGIGTNDKGELFISHEGKYYRVKSEFFESLPTILQANAYSIAGSIAGAWAGARQGVKVAPQNPYAKIGGLVLGGAIGAATGGAIDVLLGNAYLNRENTAKEIIEHATQEGMLNIVADGVGAGLIKAWQKLGRAGAKGVLHGAKNLFGKAIDYTPVLGFVKRAQDGNQAMAKELLAQTYTEQELSALKAASESFGLTLEVGAKAPKIDTAGLPKPLGDAIHRAQDIFALTNQKQFQSELLRAIRADESGHLLGFVTEAAAQSPKANAALSQILQKTTLELKRALQGVGGKDLALKEVFDELEKGTKESYDEAITKILANLYDDSYKVNLNELKDAARASTQAAESPAAQAPAKSINPQSFASFKAELESAGVAPSESANFLNFIEKNIYNEKGVSFTQLNNALKNLNAYYKQAADPNFKTHIKAAYDNFIRDDIKAGIEAIFAQNKTAYKDAKSLFDTALLDYANMKESLKLADKLKIRDRKATKQKTINALLDFAKGQGDKEANIQAITRALPKENRAHIELAMLQELFARSLQEVKNIEVFNSSAFLSHVDELKGVFTSRPARDFIDTAKSFHNLFRNDPLIAQALKPTTTDKIGSSIATSVEGAVKFQVVKGIFANLVRLLPHIPFLPSLNQKVQGAALRHHLTKALESSHSISDMKARLQALSTRPDFTNATKEHIKAFTGQLDHAQDTLLAQAETLMSKAQNAKNLQEWRTLEKYGVESLEKLDSKQWGEYVDSVLGGDIDKLKAAPNIVHIANLHPELAGQLGLENAKVFITKNSLHHFRPERKAKYGQDIPKDIFKTLPDFIEQARTAHIDLTHGNFFITRNISESEAVKIAINKDELGNYIVTASRINAQTPTGELSVKVGDAPTTPSPTEPRNLSTKPITNNHGVNTERFGDSSAQKQTSIFELAQAEKQAKEAAELEKERANAQALAEAAQAIKQRDEALQATKDANAGKSEAQRTLHHGEPIAMRETDLPHTSISVSDEQIVPLKFVVVKARDVQPNFSASELQPRAAKDERVIEQIASNFSPALIFGRGGYKDLPIIKADGQVVLGNHRVQGFKDFSKDFTTPARTLTKEQAKDTLEHITPEKLPDKLEPQEFLDGFSHIINKENFLTHLHKTPDAKERLGVLSLVQPTHERPDLELITTNAKGEPTREYVKAFENNDKQIFYVLITPQDNDKILLTGFPTSKKREIVRRINNAEAIKARDSGEISSAQSYNKSPTPSEHSTTQKLQNSRAAYEKAVKDHYGVDLAPDELLLRTPAEPLSDEQLIQIAFHSNKDDVKTLSDKTLAALGRYAPKMKDLPIIITSESLQELKSKVARTLAPEQALPDEREAGLALLAHLSKSTRQSNIAEVLNSLHHLEPQAREKVLNMFIDNAGSFYNLSHRTASLGMQNLDLRPYLLETMAATAEATFKERWENFARLNENLRHIIDTTDAQGRNAMIDIMPRVYENTMSEILGAALARFTRLENPSENLYHTLKAAPKELEELHAPAFDFESGGVTAGKSLQDMDIIDLADYLIRTGESSKEVRESLELLPKFREKWEAYKNASKESAAKDGSEAGEKVGESSAKSTPKQKIIDAVDRYTASDEFKALDKSKQQAIISLKNITPAPMPTNVEVKDIENLLKHFNSKQDRVQREFYAKLFDDTRDTPHIVLEVERDGQLRTEYIKAYEHKATHDLYYVAITQENDKIKVTGFPTTQVRKIIKEISDSKKVSGGSSGDTTNRQADKILSPELAEQSIAQEAKIFNQGAITLNTLQDFTHYAKLAGVEFASEREAKLAHKYISENIDKITC